MWSSGFSSRARVTWRQIWTESDWNVENGFEPSDEGGFALTFDLILSMAASEKRKIFSLRCGAGFVSALNEASVSGGSEISNFRRVLRALVRSRKGGTEME